MSVNELKKSAVEINAIIENLPIELSEKIPTHVKDFFKQIASDDYHFQYDKTKTLNEQNIMPKTKGVLALLYRDYICNDTERETFIKAYNSYFIQKNQSTPLMHDANVITNKNPFVPVATQKEKWYSKFFKHIKNFLNK